MTKRALTVGFLLALSVGCKKVEKSPKSRDNVALPATVIKPVVAVAPAPEPVAKPEPAPLPVPDSRALAIAAAKNAGILGSLSSMKGGAFDSLTKAGSFKSGLGDIDVQGRLNDVFGEANGGFGFGNSGSGVGGGGAGWGTIGTGKYGTIGHGSGTGSGYGSGGGTLGRGRTSAAPKKPIAKTVPPATAPASGTSRLPPVTD